MISLCWFTPKLVCQLKGDHPSLLRSASSILEKTGYDGITWVIAGIASKNLILTWKISKSLDFAREKTKRAVEFASLPTSRFVFSRAKSRLFSIFLVRTRFFSAPPSITPYCCCLRRPWTFSENKGWNDGKFDFPFISTPIKLKKYFSCSHNSILLGHQAHKIAKFWILKKSISRQLGEF